MLSDGPHGVLLPGGLTAWTNTGDRGSSPGRSEPITSVRTVPGLMGSAVSNSPVAVALLLLTAYYALVALVQSARAKRADHVLVGAAIFAGLTTATAMWP